MNKPTIEQVLGAYKNKTYRVFNGIDERAGNSFKPYDLNIFGIRSTEVKIDYFTDLIGCFYNSTPDKVDLFLWEGTTRPGKYFMQNPMNPGGCFIMIPGHYSAAYKIGKHHTQDALIQVGNLKGYRDDNKNDTFDLDPAKIFEGNNFGVNIHHKETDAETIGQSSAGCQVFKHTPEHVSFMDICRKAAVNWGDVFSYTLFDESDISK
jgi:hypothetical protein